jgi:translation initiation factor 2 beta subunit (eIF-2beta)/eIF-5
MEFNQSFRFCQTLNFASNDHKLKTRVENWCKKNNKKFILSESKSPDIIAINSFAIIVDPEFVGKENLVSFEEFQKSIEFNESTYENEELVNFHKQYSDLDENGKFVSEPTELLLTNKLNADEIISRLDEFVEIYKNNFRE